MNPAAHQRSAGSGRMVETQAAPRADSPKARVNGEPAIRKVSVRARAEQLAVA